MRTHRYRITILGGLGDTYCEAFRDFRIEPNGTNTVPNGTNTVLTGELDQAALYGAINRIQSLGLELVGLSRLADGTRLGYAVAHRGRQADACWR